MTDPATIDPGEELLARVGIAHALSQSDKAIRVFKNTPELAGEIDAAAKKFVVGEKEKAQITPPAFDYDAVSKQLAELKAPDHTAFRYLDPHLTGAYLVAVQGAVKYLASIFPRDSVTTMVTTREIRPSGLKISKFRRIWALANDLGEVFRSLNNGTLTKDQSVAMQVMFPTAFEALKMAILAEIVAKVGADRKWTLPYAKDQLLRVLTLTSDDKAGAMARLQKNFADIREQQGSPSAAGDSGPPTTLAKSTQTPTQRASL